ncbi:MAG TPA: DUF2252 domain-containing protein [Pirellulales bacterium]|jgi:uncharacterized protein (DUF2252 family)|nr:DUF2252 domain-containing protein [Pirellulales bacterium]
MAQNRLPDAQPTNGAEAVAHGAAAPGEATLDVRETLRLRGRAMRQSCPRTSHGNEILGQGDRDPLVLIDQSNEGRLASLLPVRFSRMLASPFAFFRGTAILQAYDLRGTPTSGITVQCCGDCHLANFGVFASPEGSTLFDINDFDETFPAPFEWDIKRLATSFLLAAKWCEFSAAQGRTACTAAVEAYRTAIARFAEMKVLEIWHAQTTIDDVAHLIHSAAALEKRAKKRKQQSGKGATDHVFHQLTTETDGQLRIVDQPPLLYHLESQAANGEHQMEPLFAAYRDSLSADRRVLLDRFWLVDEAFKVVGVGSVGTRCYVTLWLGGRDDPLFLQIKEARPSVLEGLAGVSPFNSDGERIVVGQRLMQAASDIFLGWTSDTQGNEYYVRQLHEHKAAVDLPSMKPRDLASYATLCGRTLARAHAKAGQAPTIHGYLGRRSNFDEAITNYALSYCDQVQQDYDAFRAAVEAGRFPIASDPPPEQAAH